ncbi:hypothetical protein [Actinobaculum sp. 313]|uniref:hypothetical protein n=1 Tax=Actinobaculum sp. 313 TaxID=2495645 RepID=UPI000D526930|nr:hypothetical protein [Actinobaculum sp. 313]AWE41693.1 hypothetical protein DDD63_01740 [Actinobaculum sp. 313]
MSSANIWVNLSWAGREPEKPSILPDGRDWEEVLYGGGVAALPDDLWLELWNSGRCVDWLWGGLSECIVSQRFLQILVEQGVPGVEYRPLTIRRRRSADIEGYYLLLYLPAPGAGSVVRRYPSDGRTPGMLVDGAVAEAILAAQLAGVSMTPAEEEYGELEQRRREVECRLQAFGSPVGVLSGEANVLPSEAGAQTCKEGVSAGQADGVAYEACEVNEAEAPTGRTVRPVDGNRRPASDWDNRFILHASDLVGDANAMSVELSWPGKDPGRPHRLPDGQEIGEVLITKGIDALPTELWLDVVSYGEQTDWLWTTDCGPVVSRRFLDVLILEAVPGIEHRRLSVRWPSDATAQNVPSDATPQNALPDDESLDTAETTGNIEDYFLLRVHATGPDAPLRLFPRNDPHAYRLDVDAMLFEKIKNAGLTEISASTARGIWDELRSEAAWLDKLMGELMAE